MKKTKFIWLFSLIVLFSLSFAACGDDDKEDEKPEQKVTTTVTITVVKDGKPVEGKAVYMFANVAKTVDLSYVHKADAMTFETTNNDGVAKFTFSGNDLNGNLRKTYYFAVAKNGDDNNYDYNEFYAEVALKAGESKDATIDMTETEPVVVPSNNTQEPVNNGGEAMEEPVNVPEVIDVTNLKIKGNQNGTISLVCDVVSNAKLKTFEIQDVNGNVVYNFLESNEQVKEKNIVIDKERVTNEKAFDLSSIESTHIPVDLYKLVIATREEKTEFTLGEETDYQIGANKSTIGAYLSIVNNKSMVMAEAKETPAEVIARSSEDGYSVVGLIRASYARSADVASHAGRVALFQNGIDVTEVKEGGVIFTESGCIIKINSIVNSSVGEATIKTVTYKSNSDFTVGVPYDYCSK